MLQIEQMFFYIAIESVVPVSVKMSSSFLNIVVKAYALKEDRLDRPSIITSLFWFTDAG